MSHHFESDFRNIYLWRKKLDLSQRAFANLVGVSHGSVSLWESGKRVPNREDTEKLCEALGQISEMRLKKGPDWVSADELLEPLSNDERNRVINVILAMIGQLPPPP